MKFFDLHCDTPYECFVKKQDFSKNSLAVSSAAANLFEKWYQTFAVWIKDDEKDPFGLYKKIIEDFKMKIREKPENLFPVFSVEGGAVLEGDSQRLYELKKDEIKMLTLTWNGENEIAGGVNSDKGLSDFGKEVIKVMNDLSIACDLSHLNKKSYFSALERAKFPIATHSSAAAVCEHPRNLSDSQIKELCKSGGIIGICPYGEFLGGDTVLKIYENLFHIADMGYEDNIAFGSDFDGARQSEVLSDISKIPQFYTELSKKGLSRKLLDKFFYKNAYNYIAKLD